MTKDELLTQIAKLVDEYEGSNDSAIIGCYVDFLPVDGRGFYEWNGEKFDFHSTGKLAIELP